MNSLPRPLWLCLTLGCLVLSAGCANPTKRTDPLPLSSAGAPTEWMAPLPPLPHGASTRQLQDWWQNLGDPLLVELIAAAQEVSPTLASASARLAQSRAGRSSAAAARLPSLDANLMAQRGVNQTSPTEATLLQGSLDASWEVDVFGASQAGVDAADARLQGAQANWHVARVSVAAEVASQYLGWRTCQQVLALQLQDADSRAHTAYLTQLSAHVGMSAPSTAALTNAAAAEARGRLALQQNQCDSAVKALVALTAIAETPLRERLQAAPPVALKEDLLSVDSVPAQVLAQRPDIYAAEREVAAASADLGASQAQRYPRLSIGGSIGALNFRNSEGSFNLSTWSVGPVALNLPIFDAGRRSANVDAAQARYTEAVALYRAKVRDAAREVELALVSLSSSATRRQQAAAAVEAYATALSATMARAQVGSANQLELEDARRSVLASTSTLRQLELERSNAWIALYRALGGGWNPNADADAS